MDKNWRRDCILEQDETYAVNLRTLQRRRSSGKLDGREFAAYAGWLTRSALRRSGLSLREVNDLAHA